MAELYTVNKAYQDTIKYYQELSEQYGWNMNLMDEYGIIFTKKLELGTEKKEIEINFKTIILKLINNSEYQIDNDESDKGFIAFDNEAIGEGFSLHLTGDIIDFVLSGDAVIKKDLKSILIELEHAQSNV